MKILHVFKSFYPDTYGGIEKFIHELSRSMAKKYATEIHILAMGTKNQTIEKDFYTLHFAKTNIKIASTTFSFSAIKIFKQLAKQVDIIHYHYPYPFADLLHSISRVDKPYIVTYHSDIIKQKKLLAIYKPLMKRFLSRAEYILPTSPNYLQSSQTLQQIKSPKKVIAMSLDKSNYQIDEENLRIWRNKIGFEKFFIYIGGLRYYKGLDILIDAMQGLDYPLVILGDGDQRNILEQKVKANNLQNTKFLGYLNDKDKISLLKLSYALILPSNIRTEAFGLALLEASIFAKPMLSCEIGTGTTYVNIDKQTGLVAKPNDRIDLREKIKELWQDDTKAAQYGINARKRFDDIFSLDRMVISYKSVYDEMIESGIK